jgi:hypothetical protein
LRAKNRATHSAKRHLIVAKTFPTTSEPSPAAGGGTAIPS